MQITLDDFFKYSYMISVSDKRLSLTEKVFGYHNLKMPTIWKGVRTYKDRIINCNMSHKKLIEFAEFNDFPFVCIFEDDAYPCNNVLNKLKEILLDIDDKSDVIYLGYFDNYETIPFYGGHAYIVFKSGYEKILNYYNTEDNPYADRLWKIKDLHIVKSKEKLFIQYNPQFDSNHKNHFMYSSNLNETKRLNPPKGFPSIRDIL